MKNQMYDLPCLDRCKSFYGKAKILELENGEKILYSYETPVAKLDANNNFYRLWSGESMTTTRHIDSFIKLFNVDGGGLAWWREQKVVAI